MRSAKPRVITRLFWPIIGRLVSTNTCPPAGVPDLTVFQPGATALSDGAHFSDAANPSFPEGAPYFSDTAPTTLLAGAPHFCDSAPATFPILSDAADRPGVAPAGVMTATIP